MIDSPLPSIERIGRELDDFFRNAPDSRAYVLVAFVPKSRQQYFCSPVDEQIVDALAELVRAYGSPVLYRLKITPKVRPHQITPPDLAHWEIVEILTREPASTYVHIGVFIDRTTLGYTLRPFGAGCAYRIKVTPKVRP